MTRNVRIAVAALALLIGLMVASGGADAATSSVNQLVTSLTFPVTSLTVPTTATAPSSTTTAPNVTTTTAPGGTTTVATTPIPTIVVNPTTTTAAPADGETTTTVPADDTDCGAPTIDSISPASGPPGTKVTVTGSCFVIGGTTVLLGDVEVPATVSGERAFGDTLRFVVPEGTDLGAVGVLVRTANGDSAVVPAGAFTVTSDASPTDGNSGSLQPIVTPASSSTGGGGLPRTGTNAGFLALLGLMMLGAGALAFRASKRISQN